MTPGCTGDTERDETNEPIQISTPCPICGAEMAWIECFECGGEGEFDWETLQDEDPLWYGPDDTEQCNACSGKGGWWECFNIPHPEKAKGL